jgi:hypothetical protein
VIFFFDKTIIEYTEVDFNVLVSSYMPEFSFVSVTENEVWNDVMSIK